MHTVGELARGFGLSRSTLLYYDSIGLLRPSARSPAGYRLYAEHDRERLATICRYREAGLPLADVRRLLDGPADRTGTVLERRLEQLNDEIGRLREQQRVIVRLMRNRGKLRRARALNKAAWVALLRATGLSDEDMRRWHVEFERMSPAAHRDFLESLGIPRREVESIRRWSRENASGSA
jgi:DNA-binding transcriptional MerR regulator